MRKLASLILLTAIIGIGCSLLQNPKAPVVADLIAEKAVCVLQNMKDPPLVIAEKCAIQPGDIDKYLQLVAAAKTGAMADAGAP